MADSRRLGVYCSISGQVPEVPVVSAKSGHVFERRYIEEALAASGGICPETGHQLAPTDLIELRQTGAVVEPVLPADGSMSSILGHVQREWDAAVLEMHQIKTKLNETRKELANALYKLNAAEQVIARLHIENETLLSKPSVDPTARGEQPEATTTEEKDIAMEDASATPTQTNGSKAEPSGTETKPAVEDTPMESVTSGKLPTLLPDVLLDQAKQKGTELQTWRKSRTLPSTCATSIEVSAFAERASVNLAGAGNAITCIERGHSGVTFAASSDGRLFTLDTEEGLQARGEPTTAHDSEKGGVASLRWDRDGNRLVSAGGDGLLKVWDVSEGCTQVESITHDGGLVQADVHAAGALVLCALQDGRWIWRDLAAGGKAVCAGGGLGEGGELRSAVLHPDGMIFVTGGADGKMRVWNVHSMECVVTLEAGGPVAMMDMSEKGFYMASCANGVVKLWDLRKQAVTGEVGGGVAGVRFDGYGEFGCAVGEGSVRLFAGKKKAKIVGEGAWRGVDGEVPGVGRLGCAWGEDARFVMTGDGDGVVRRFG